MAIVTQVTQALQAGFQNSVKAEAKVSGVILGKRKADSPATTPWTGATGRTVPQPREGDQAGALLCLLARPALDSRTQFGGVPPPVRTNPETNRRPKQTQKTVHLRMTEPSRKTRVLLNLICMG